MKVFAPGVVSGVTMSFQFGINWPGLMARVGNIAAPLLAYEVLTAFFLEASFLAVMLSGYGRVPNRIHTLAMLLHAVLDGFEPGVGIPLRGKADEAQRDRMVASIGPFRDANETWLVLRGCCTSSCAASPAPITAWTGCPSRQ